LLALYGWRKLLGEKTDFATVVRQEVKIPTAEQCFGGTNIGSSAQWLQAKDNSSDDGVKEARPTACGNRGMTVGVGPNLFETVVARRYPERGPSGQRESDSAAS
jgi:hypothetical protein